MSKGGFSFCKAQSVLEESMLIFLLVVAFLAMGVYIKRAFQGRYRSLADSVGEQYSPSHTSSNITVNFYTDKTTSVSSYEKDGKSYTDTTVNLNEDSQIRSGSENLDSLADENLF